MKTAEKWGRAGSGFLYYCPKDNTVLLLERSDAVMDPGVWGIPGGALKGTEGFYDEDELDEDFGEEELRSGAMNETEEELGHVPAEAVEVGRTTINFKGFKYTTFIMSVEPETKAAITRDARLNWESNNLGWFSLSDLPVNLHYGVAAAIKQFWNKDMDSSEASPLNPVSYQKRWDRWSNR